MRAIHHTARQVRSADTEERIATSARELLRSRGLEAVTMADIAARAGVSIGGLYARFPSKEALAVYLADKRVFEELERQSAGIFDDADTSAGDVVRRYMSTAAALYRRNRPLLRAVYVATRTGTDEALRARVREFNQKLHQRLREAVLARCRGARPEAVNLGILSMMSTLRELVLFGQPVSDLARLSEEEVVEELATQFMAYVDCRRKKK
ncbi:MAG TPA: helix-turn-helix domain-containing protein [Thermoanaerobaculia bacterium]|nr:helix-turn-helix domain-containing protein [Thermoanaerobaculia bacterium]